MSPPGLSPRVAPPTGKIHLYFIHVTDHRIRYDYDYRAVCTSFELADLMALDITREENCTRCGYGCNYTAYVEKSIPLVDISNREELLTFIVQRCVPTEMRTRQLILELDKYYPNGFTYAL